MAGQEKARILFNQTKVIGKPFETGCINIWSKCLPSKVSEKLFSGIQWSRGSSRKNYSLLRTPRKRKKTGYFLFSWHTSYFPLYSSSLLPHTRWLHVVLYSSVEEFSIPHLTQTHFALMKNSFTLFWKMTYFFFFWIGHIRFKPMIVVWHS